MDDTKKRYVAMDGGEIVFYGSHGWLVHFLRESWGWDDVEQGQGSPTLSDLLGELDEVKPGVPVEAGCEWWVYQLPEETT